MFKNLVCSYGFFAFGYCFAGYVNHRDDFTFDRIDLAIILVISTALFFFYQWVDKKGKT